MKKPYLPILTLALAGLLSAPAALRAEDAADNKGGPQGRRGGPRGGGNPERRVEMMKQNLNLTDDQVTKIKAILEKEHEDINAVLTPEQQEKMKQGGGRGGRGGPGGEAGAGGRKGNK